MPEEIFIISLVGIIAGSAVVLGVVRGILSVVRARVEGHRGAGSGSLTSSELQRLVQRAVEDASQPLLDKIEDLEHEVRALRPAHPLPPRAEPTRPELMSPGLPPEEAPARRPA